MCVCVGVPLGGSLKKNVGITLLVLPVIQSKSRNNASHGMVKATGRLVGI